MALALIMRRRLIVSVKSTFFFEVFSTSLQSLFLCIVTTTTTTTSNRENKIKLTFYLARSQWHHGFPRSVLYVFHTRTS